MDTAVTQTLIRTLETLKGRGDVLLVGRPISTVLYTINVRQELVRDGGNYSAGPQFVDGVILVIDGERNLLNGKELLLRLENGRKAGFLAHQGDLVSGTFRIDVRLSDWLYAG